MKLIRNYDDNSLELYDVVGDITETKNRAKDKPQLAKHLNDKLGMAEGDQSAYRVRQGIEPPSREGARKLKEARSEVDF